MRWCQRIAKQVETVFMDCNNIFSIVMVSQFVFVLKTATMTDTFDHSTKGREGPDLADCMPANTTPRVRLASLFR